MTHPLTNPILLSLVCLIILVPSSGANTTLLRGGNDVETTAARNMQVEVIDVCDEFFNNGNQTVFNAIVCLFRIGIFIIFGDLFSEGPV